MTSVRQDYDAVVVGAGPAGLATALALRHTAEASVLVVDAGRPERDRVGETAPAGVLVALGRLGLAERFGEGPHLPCPGTASIWGRDRVAYDDFVVNPTGPAWRLDRPSFDRMLAEAAVDSGAQLMWRTRFAGRTETPDGEPRHRLQLVAARAGPFVVSARCVVDATGAAAHLARALGARRRVDDRLVALVRFGPAAAGTTTLQTLVEAVHDGWWYGARIPGDQAVVMLVTDRPRAARLRAGGPGAFDAALASTSLVRTVTPPSGAGARRATLAVYSSALDRTAGAGWIAVGDAAASYDPLAGQGVHKALVDGLAAAEDVWAMLNGDPLDPRSARSSRRDKALDEYRRRRASVYRAETRFPGSPFWEARKAATAQAPRYSA